jgi:tetratricopeptide (TPR) repeat protein
VLLVDPNQTEALAGLARQAKQKGDAKGVRTYLDRLRKVNPRDPAIAAIERMRVLTPQDNARLDEAGRLAAAKRPDEAMKIYNEVFGADGSSGKWAEPYYQTQAAATGGRPEAIARLRGMMAREPGNETYRLWLARILSYEPKTRLEAMQLLEGIHDSGTAEQARTVWRQALVWEKENPAVQASLGAYLKRYPDPELNQAAVRIRDTRERADQDADKQRGFLALQQKDMTTAERQFEDVLRRSPKDVNAIAGLGFVRLDQQRFSDAVALFDKARALAPGRQDIRDGHENAQYWAAMQRGQLMQQRDADAAIAAYEGALAIRPQEEAPVIAIGEIMLRRDNLPEAAARFEQILERSPSNIDATAGLGFVRLKERRFADAVRLLERVRAAAPNRPDIEDGYRTATFWGVMTDASAAFEQGQSQAAMKGYEQALAIDPKSPDALLGLGGSAERLRNYPAALNAYEQLIAVAPNQAQGWLGLMRSQINLNRLDAALQTSARVPPALREKFEARPEYLAQLSLAYFSTKRDADGDRMLQRALDAATAGDSDEALSVRLQVADMLTRQGHREPALRIYSQATDLHPTSVMAWQGLVGVYAASGDYTRAMAAVRSMPRAAYDAATKNAGFLNAAAAAYAADGRCGDAEGLLVRSLELDRAAGRQPAADTGLQLADIWMRQRRYDKAIQQYRAVITADARAIDAWRGYMLALHNLGDVPTMLDASRGIPAEVRPELEKDSGFLTMLASAHSTAGQHDQSVALLEQVRARSRSAGRAAPADLEIQLGWALVAAARADEAAALIPTVRARGDLTAPQREAVDALWLSSTLARVDAAVKGGDTERAIAMLTEAWREAPQNAKFPSALAAVYLRKGDRGRALDVYREWGLNGAEAGDYRAAAGAALAAHDTPTAERFMGEGLARFPGDRDLLRMRGRQAVARGDYRDAEKLLTAALAAKPPAAVAGPSAKERPAPFATVESSSPACRQSAPSTAFAGPPVMLMSLQGVARLFTRVKPPAQSPATPQSPAPTPASPPTAPPPEGPASQPPPQTERATPDPAQREQAEETDEIADDIDVVRNRNTPFASFGVAFGGRAGDPGISRLSVRDVTPGGSATASNTVRFGIDVHSLTLTTGSPDGLSDSPFGTLGPGVRFSEQRASGYTAEMQISTDVAGFSVGTPPSEFLVKEWTGGLRLGRPNGPIRLMVVRDRVKDTLLSYAGARDPGTGLVWGGVVSNTASLITGFDLSGRGAYLALGGAIVRGENVANNWNAEATAGAYWTVSTGGPTALTVGASGNALHYDKNLSFFTLGHGGYFSPQRYWQASLPLSWSIRHTRVFWEMLASPGFQYFTTEDSPYYPLGLVPSSSDSLVYEGTTRKGANYNVTAKLEVRIAPHLHLSAFGAANNTRDFNSRTIGVALKLLANRLPGTTDLRVRAIPDWRGNQPLGN